MQLAHKSFLSVALDRICHAGVNALVASRRSSARGRFFLLPGDYIGTTILAEGAFEKGYLASLDALIDHARGRGMMEGAGLAAIDIGANIGTHTVYLRSRFARVHAFEPNPMIHHVLSANIALNKLDGVTAHCIALSDREEILNYAQDAQGNLGGSGFAGAADAPGVAMPLSRADTFIMKALAPGERVAFIKIDVEGLEDKVVAGLEALVRRDGPLVICEIANAALGSKAAALLAAMGHVHIYEIHNASRFGQSGGAARFFNVLRNGVDYQLTPLAAFEDRIYPMIVASPKKLLD